MNHQPSSLPVTVVVPTWNSAEFVGPCLEALAGQSYQDFEVLLVDNGSTDGSLARLDRSSLVLRVHRLATNRGFAGAAAIGCALCQSEWIALLNVDTEADPDWLAELLRVVESGDGGKRPLGAVASKMLSMKSPEMIDGAGDTLSWYGSAKKRGHGAPARDLKLDGEVFSASAGAALYLRSALQEVGGFDASFESYFEDVDLGLRLQLAGYRCQYAPRARVLHYVGGSGTPRPKYVQLVTRNRLLTLGKSLPWSLLLRHGHRLVWGQIYFLIAYRRPLRSLLGIAGLLARLPHLVSERRRLRSLRRLSAREIDSLLTCDLGEPSLRELFWSKLRHGG